MTMWQHVTSISGESAHHHHHLIVHSESFDRLYLATTLGQVVCMSQQNGIVQYKLEFGGGQDGTKKVVSMKESINTGFLYVLTTKKVMKNLTMTERGWAIEIFEIRQDSGIINQQVSLSSLGFEDQAVDMQINSKGIWILASMSSGICINTACARYEQWENNFAFISSFTLILIKAQPSFTIIQVEVMKTQNFQILQSIPASTLKTKLGFIPTRFFVAINSIALSDLTFIFLGQRDNDSGLFFASPKQSSQLFQSSSCTNVNCKYCSYTDRSYCQACNLGYTLESDGICRAVQSNGYLTAIHNGITQSIRCHYTCKTCDTNDLTKCLTCDGTKSFFLSGTQCKCSGALQESKGECKAQCDEGNTAIIEQKCLKECPADTFSQLDRTGSTYSLKKTVTQQTFTYTQGSLFADKGANLKVPKLHQIPENFTFQFWLIKKQQEIFQPSQNVNRDFLLFSAFDRLTFFANYSSSNSKHYVSISFRQNYFSQTQLPIAAIPGQIDYNQWVKIIVCAQTVDSLTSLFLHFWSSSTATFQTHTLLSPIDDLQVLQWNVPSILILNRPFIQGAYREIMFMPTFLSTTHVQQDLARGYSLAQQKSHKIIMYYKLDKDYKEEISQTLGNDSQERGMPSIQPLDNLQLQIWDDITFCTGFKFLKQPTIPVMRGDFLKQNLQRCTGTFSETIIPYNPDIGNSFELTQGEEVIGRFIVTASSSSSLSVSPDQDQNPRFFEAGFYGIKFVGSQFTIFLGQVYIIESAKYIYPFNRGSFYIINQAFQMELGDLAEGDQLYFTSKSACSNVLSTDTDAIKFTRGSDMSIGPSQAFPSGVYQICWRQAYAKDTNQQTFIQVNEFNYWIGLGQLKFGDALVPNQVQLMNNYTSLNLATSAFLPGDYFQYYSDSPVRDCLRAKAKGQKTQYFNILPTGVPIFPPQWFGNALGVSSGDDLLHLCYLPFDVQRTQFPMRVKPFLSTLPPAEFTLTKLNYPPDLNQFKPEISKWFVDYGGTVTLSNLNSALWFQFVQTPGATYYPNGHLSDKTIRGKIEIRRMKTVDNFGTLAVDTVVWSKNDIFSIDLLPFKEKQGPIECFQSNATCQINLKEAKVDLREGEIYTIVLYSYSFIKVIPIGQPGAGTHQLFGNSYPSSLPVYSHLFFVRGWSLESRLHERVGLWQTYLELKGSNLRNLTKGISIQFYLTNSTVDGCNNSQPTGTVLKDDILEDRTVIRDFNILKKCTDGLIQGNIYLWRAKQTSSEGDLQNIFVTNYLNFTIGSIGCDQSCLKCNGPSKNQCLECKNSTLYLNTDGSCVEYCPKLTFQNTCVEACPTIGYFESDEKVCTKCTIGCQVCKNQSVCLECEPMKFLFEGICLDQGCPDTDLISTGLMLRSDQIYENDYSKYTCRNINKDLKGFRTRFAKTGYRSRVPLEQELYVKASVKIQDQKGEVNCRTYFRQIHPQGNLSLYTGQNSYFNLNYIKDSFVFDSMIFADFDGGKTGYFKVSDNSSTWRLRNPTLSKLGDAFTYKIFVRSESEQYDRDINVIEFLGNTPPVAHEVFSYYDRRQDIWFKYPILSKSSEQLYNYTMKTWFNLTTVNLSKPITEMQSWYDDEKVYESWKQKLWYTLYYELLDESHNVISLPRLLIPMHFSKQHTFIFKFPPVSNQYYRKNEVRVTIRAQDKYAAQVSQTITFNVSNTFSKDKNREATLFELYKLYYVQKAADPIKDRQLQLYLANVLEIAIENPKISIASGVQCLIDYHCFNHGTCSTERVCECEYPYTGYFCQLTVNETFYASKLVQLLRNGLLDYFGSQNLTYITNGDLEYAVYLFKASLILPEKIQGQQDYIERGIEIIERCINAHEEVVYTYHRQFIDHFFDLMVRIQQNGVRTQYVVDKFLRRLALRINLDQRKKGFAGYHYSTQEGIMEVNITRIPAFALIKKGAAPQGFFIFTVNKDLRAQVRIPFGLLEASAPGDIINVNDLRIQMVWSQDPIIELRSTPILQMVVMDIHGDAIQIDASRLTEQYGLIQYIIPFIEPTVLLQFEAQNLRCFWNENAKRGAQSSEGCGLQVFTYASCINKASCPFNPNELKEQALGICYCKMLPTSGVYIAPIHLEPFPNQRVNLGIYQDFYALDYWKDSFGFYAISGSTTLYLIGLFLSLLADYHALRRIKRRLLLEYAKLETTQNPLDREVSQESSVTEVSVTNDDTEVFTKNANAQENTLAIEINKPVVQQKKIMKRAKFQFAGRRLLKAMNETNIGSSNKSFVDATEDDIFQTHQRTISSISNLTANNTRISDKNNITSQYEGGEDDKKQHSILDSDEAKEEEEDEEAKTVFNAQQNRRMSRQQQQPLIIFETLPNLLQTDQNLVVKDIFGQTDFSVNNLQASNEVNDLRFNATLQETPFMPSDSPFAKLEQLSILNDDSLAESQIDKIENLYDVEDTKQIPQPLTQQILQESINPEKVVQEQKQIDIIQQKPAQYQRQVNFVVQPASIDNNSEVMKDESTQEDLSVQNERKAKDMNRIINVQSRVNRIIQKSILASKLPHSYDKEDIKELKMIKQEEKFTFLNIFKYGNPLLNLMFVDSFLMPRHVRWTLLMMNIMLVWFLCAIFYNQTKSPIEIPDMTKKASSISQEDIWLALITPAGNIIIMYLFAALFYIPSVRLKNSIALKNLEDSLKELQKEINIRFILAYTVSICVYCGIGWYLIKFTSSYGWKTSWAWWYSGIGSAIMLFFFYNLLINLLQWLLYKLWKPLGLCLWKVRRIKQASEEV